MRKWILLFGILLFTASCQALSRVTPTPILSQPTQPGVTQSLAWSVTPSPTPQPTATLTPTPTRVPSPTPEPDRQGYQVQYHPEGGLYAGDQVSFEVIPPPGENLEGKSIELSLPEKASASGDFAPYGIAGRQQATLLWAWDTTALEAGDYPVRFSVLPGGPTWTETVTLQPQDQVPPPEPGAAWASARSECCVFHYITGTPGERDLAALMQAADQNAREAVASLGVEFTAPITVTLVPRVLGHGGFAMQDTSVSYLDRNYVGNDFGLVLKHEMVHVLDGRILRDFRPSLFVEGLAVYITGGHFKLEALMPRAAALLELPYRGVPQESSWYIPLERLVTDFYHEQHEISYLEGAALIEYLVKRFGWERFSAFYSEIHQPDGASAAQAVDQALQAHFGLGFAQLENDFLQALRGLEVTEAHWADMQLTVMYMDTVRRYQAMLDPSAYFNVAWLLDNQALRARGIVADYLRHPETAENIALETLLEDAGREFYAKQYEAAESSLDTANLVLDALEEGAGQPFGVNPIAQEYFDLVTDFMERGYEPQRIDLAGESGGSQAEIWATKDGVLLEKFTP